MRSRFRVGRSTEGIVASRRVVGGSEAEPLSDAHGATVLGDDEGEIKLKRSPYSSYDTWIRFNMLDHCESCCTLRRSV
jgi:hypothetical protein